MTYAVIVLLLLTLSFCFRRVRLFFGFLIFGVTGAEGDRARVGIKAAWQLSGAAMKHKQDFGGDV